MNFKLKKSNLVIFVASILLAACGGTDSSPASALKPEPGILVISPFNQANIYVGESTFAVITLSGSVDVESPVIVTI